MWTRAWRFANIYAYLGLDLLFALLWFAATIALGVWESQGVKKGQRSRPERLPDLRLGQREQVQSHQSGRRLRRRAVLALVLDGRY
jgi:hypothetical protein